MESEVQRFLSGYGKDKQLVVIFYATWFRPSVKVKECWELAELAGEQRVFINVDEAIELVEELQLVCVPAVYWFKDGEIIERKVGIANCEV